MERGFRLGDRVSVHGLIRTDGKVIPGRVIATDRKSKYGENVIVLYDLGDAEMMETFKPDGRRYIPTNSCHITLGWPKE